MTKQIKDIVKKVLLVLLLYFAFWGVLTHYFIGKRIYIEPYDQMVKIVNINAEAQIKSPVPKNK